MDLSKLTVLVVDDNQQTRGLLDHILRALGVGRVLQAATGRQGFDLAVQCSPDIILTDWEMPLENGVDMVRRLRTSPRSSNKTVPILMITGYAAPMRVFEARDAGVTEFLVKPFTPAELARRIAHIVNWPRPTVVCDAFVGPDRRRARRRDYNGPERRSDTMVQ
jgi:two-component system, chemotaxis family, chemotaxis protein CheY